MKKKPKAPRSKKVVRDIGHQLDRLVEELVEDRARALVREIANELPESTRREPNRDVSPGEAMTAVRERGATPHPGEGGGADSAPLSASPGNVALTPRPSAAPPRPTAPAAPPSPTPAPPAEGASPGPAGASPAPIQAAVIVTPPPDIMASHVKKAPPAGAEDRVAILPITPEPEPALPIVPVGQLPPPVAPPRAPVAPATDALPALGATRRRNRLSELRTELGTLEGTVVHNSELGYSPAQIATRLRMKENEVRRILGLRELAQAPPEPVPTPEPLRPGKPGTSRRLHFLQRMVGRRRGWILYFVELGWNAHAIAARVGRGVDEVERIDGVAPA